LAESTDRHRRAQALGASIARDVVAEDARVIVADVQDQAGAAFARELGSSNQFVHLSLTYVAAGRLPFVGPKPASALSRPW